MQQPEEYLTVTEARKLMQVSENKMASMIKSGELPTIPNPRNRSSKLIPRSAVDTWLEQAAVRPPSIRKKPPRPDAEAQTQRPAA